MQKTFKEYAEIFGRYGIQGIDDKMLESLERWYKEMGPDVIANKAASLLTALGGGSYDFETNIRTFSKNGVYSFDMEVFAICDIYTVFLEGVSSLDAQELDFKNIEEDTSQVDWDEGTGKQSVSFEWKNRQFTLEAEVQEDWFDLRVIGQLNDIIKEYGNGKQLFVTTDGYQECIIFYRDSQWAKGFQEETGLKLEEEFEG